MTTTNKLSYMKIGTKEFHLAVGDTFFTNGHSFSYTPTTKENQYKLPMGNYHRSSRIEITKKYKEAILANSFSNLEIIKKEGVCITYRVMEVEKVVLPENTFGELWYIGIGIKNDRKDLFEYETAKIKSRTEKQIKLEKDLNYRSVYNTEGLLNVIFGKAHIFGTDRLKSYDEFGIFIEVTENATEEKFEKIEKYKDLLFKALQSKLNFALEKAKMDLDRLNKLGENSGY